MQEDQSKNCSRHATKESNLYKAAVLPHLTRCHLALCDTSVELMIRTSLNDYKKEALRVVYNEKQASYFQLSKRAKLPTLMSRRLQDICILMR